MSEAVQPEDGTLAGRLQTLGQVLRELELTCTDAMESPELAMFFLRSLSQSIDELASLEELLNEDSSELGSELMAQLSVFVPRLREVYSLGWQRTINSAEGKETKFFFPRWDNYEPRNLSSPPDLGEFSKQLGSLLAVHSTPIETLSIRLQSGVSTLPALEKFEMEFAREFEVMGARLALRAGEAPSESDLSTLAKDDENWLNVSDAIMTVLNIAYSRLDEHPNDDAVRKELERATQKGRIRKHPGNSSLRYLAQDVVRYALEKAIEVKKKSDAD